MGVGLGPEPGEPDPSLFPTVFIARALAACGDRDGAPAMLARALAYLRTHMEAPGVWRHWTDEHPQFAALPVDLDDTACISSVLSRNGVAVPGNASLLLANRDEHGLFRTWLIPRWPAPRHAGYWRVAARRWRMPLHARGFWRTSAEPGDVDMVVNAHVLHHLGDGPHAEPVVARLIDVVRRGEEDRCDKWYRSAFLFHASLARCIRVGVTGLRVVREEACSRIVDGVRQDGSVGDGSADAAFAVMALADWDAASDERAQMCAHLGAVQATDGSWPAEPVYYGGPRHHPAVPAWGSRELTTGLCLEALVRGRP